MTKYDEVGSSEGLSESEIENSETCFSFALNDEGIMSLVDLEEDTIQVPSNNTEEKKKGFSHQDYLDYLDTIEDSRKNPENVITVAEYKFTGKDTALFFPDNDPAKRYAICINGAEVRSDTPEKFPCYVTYKTLPNGEKREAEASFRIGNRTHLGKIFKNSPYGIIKKNRTGVGATTLEVNAPRNSIIVFPTKQLAYNKAISKDNKYPCLYFGSELKDAEIPMPSIEEYLADRALEYKKILVVADSLPKLLDNHLRAPMHNDYFLMIDEIDTFQSDSTFRPKLEDAIDRYYDFDSSQRCLVTATLKDFSHPRLQVEPVVNIEYHESLGRTIHLIHTNNSNESAAKRIEDIFFNTDEKIVIAYNKVQYIRQIIEALPDECKQECSILCSETSKAFANSGDIAYYGKLDRSSKLPNRITFITCAYFSGIDIKERFTLISVSNIAYFFSLLSLEDYVQIAGRCRDGLIREYIIYNTREYTGDIKYPSAYRDGILRYAADIKAYIDNADALAQRHNRLVGKSFLRVKKAISDEAKVYFGKGNTIRIIRDNGKISYFNIDALYEMVKLRVDLYADPDALFLALKQQGHQIVGDAQVRDVIEVSERQKQGNQKIDDEFADIDTEQEDRLIARLTELYEKGALNDDTLKKERKELPRKYQQFIDRFIKLYVYLPFERLIEELPDKGQHKKTFRGYNNAVIFWALSNVHPFKREMKGRFVKDRIYSADQIKERINIIYDLFFDKQILTNSHASILGEYFKIQREDERAGSYKIISYNKFDFEDVPLTVIPATENLMELDLIEFSSGGVAKKKKKKKQSKPKGQSALSENINDVKQNS